MKIVKVDERGRLCLKKVIIPLPEYYKLYISPHGKLILEPIIDKEEVKLLNKEKECFCGNENNNHTYSCPYSNSKTFLERLED